jgi:hypothetical protein
LVRISAGTMPTESFRWFLQSLQENAGIGREWPPTLPSTSFPIHYLLIILSFGSEVHPTSYPMGAGGSFLGAKRSGREADHSL